MTNFIQTLLGYHAWANRDLLEKLQRLEATGDGEALHAALRLMNHSYVVARIFAGHLTGKAHGYVSDNTPETPTLAGMSAAIAASDTWLSDYAAKADEAELAEFIAFDFTDGDRGGMTRQEMLTHVVLHAGYHRGEIGRILSDRSITPPWDTFAVYLHQTKPSRRQGRVAA